MMELIFQCYPREPPWAILYMLPHLGARPGEMTAVASGTEDELQREGEFGDR